MLADVPAITPVGISWVKGGVFQIEGKLLQKDVLLLNYKIDKNVALMCGGVG